LKTKEKKSAPAVRDASKVRKKKKCEKKGKKLGKKSAERTKG